MSDWTLALPYPRPPMSLNTRMHHMKEHRLRQQIKRDVWMLARSGKLPKDLQQIRVTLLWVVRANRRRDTDNPVPSLKPMIDALVQYGLVPDDSAANVRSEVRIVEPSSDLAHGLYLVIADAADGYDTLPDAVLTAGK